MKRRILFLEGNIDGTVGGSYYVMIDLVNALDKTRYEPVIGFHTDNFLVPGLRKQGIETIIFDNPASFEFKSKSLNKTLAPAKKIINLFRKFILPAIRYSKFLRKHNIDLVDVNNSITRNHKWMLAAMIAGIPCISHEMGINTRFNFAARFFGKRLKSIICVSNIIKETMNNVGLNYSNITVIHNGLDVKRYALKETPDELRVKYKLGHNDKVIGVVGNIKKWKGQETIVRAMGLLITRHPDLKCFLVGAVSEVCDDTTRYKEKLDQIVEENGLKGSVIFTGFQKNPIDYMNLMDVVVHTSIDPEPFGIVLLEAMFLSKPLITTTIGGPAEIIENNKSGLLVEPGKPELLAEAVKKLLDDPVYAAGLGKQGNVRLHQQFTIEKNAEQTMKIFNNAFQ